VERWVDREAEKRFIGRYFARGNGLPVTLDIGGALVKAASETGGCPRGAVNGRSRGRSWCRWGWRLVRPRG
jgi:hypothetical protein